MSVRDQLNFTEKRIVYLADAADVLQTPLAVDNALCTYSTGGQVTVTIPNLLISSTGGGPAKVLQLHGLPPMAHQTTNLQPSFPQNTPITFVTWGLSGIAPLLNLTNFSITAAGDTVSPNELVVLLHADPLLGTPFPANSTVYLFAASLTYKWVTLPEHGGI